MARRHYNASQAAMFIAADEDDDQSIGSDLDIAQQSNTDDATSDEEQVSDERTRRSSSRSSPHDSSSSGSSPSRRSSSSSSSHSPSSSGSQSTSSTTRNQQARRRGRGRTSQRVRTRRTGLRGIGANVRVITPGRYDRPKAMPADRFVEETGPQCDLTFLDTGFSYFMLSVGDDFFQVLAENTNLHAAHISPPVNLDPAAPHATSDDKWVETNADEMKAYVGINIAMGLHSLPEYKDYWSEDTLLQVPYVSKIMTRTRYEKLCQYFHVTDPRTTNPNDKIDKVRNFVTTLQQKFPSNIKPGKELSVDEAMISFDGRLSWKQYMPKKPVKWGIKLWCLCDGQTGYCLNFSVYCGGQGNDPVATMGLGYTVIMSLMQNYLLRHHCVFADNFFSSLVLASDLAQADTEYCGTIRATRQRFPAELRNIKLPAGANEQWVNDDDLLLCKWRDKRDIFMIATCVDSGTTTKMVRRQKQLVQLEVPNCIMLYNKYKCGVDHLDQYRSYYEVGRSGRKWWKYLFWSLLDIAIINAYILFTLRRYPLPSNRRQWSLKTFKVGLVHALCDNFTSRKRKSGASEIPIKHVDVVGLLPGHDLVCFAERKRSCEACLRSNRRQTSGHSVESTYGCAQCQAHLCRRGGCFQQFHQFQ